MCRFGEMLFFGIRTIENGWLTTKPFQILKEMCNHEVEVKMFIAMRKRLSNDLFVRLASDPSAIVRQQVVANRKVPLDLLRG